MNGWPRVFCCDLRALATFRLTLALVLFGVMIGCSGRLTGNALPWLGAIAAILLFLGYRTRLIAVLSWLILLAVFWQVAEPPGEAIRMLMALSFLNLFLPLGARYSVDVAMDPSPHAGQRLGSLATFALTVQVAWLLVGPAVARALSIDVQPSTSPNLQSAAVAAVALIALLPSVVFDGLGKRAAATHRDGLRIYYDRNCGFCQKICLIFRTFLLLGDTPVRPAQDEPEAFAIMQEYNTWVVFDHDGTSYIRWHAVLLLMRRSWLMRPLGLLLTASGMGRWCDWLYGAIAATRGWWSRVTALLMPYRHVDVGLGRAAGIALAAWMAAMLACNLWLGTADWSGSQVPDVIIDGFALDQRWRWLGSR